ncbi:MAG: hypothetical protein HY289_12450 [Planctomycetes bacterium]|nr:hypothetical protein [Planctomycetota bacterium]
MKRTILSIAVFTFAVVVVSSGVIEATDKKPKAPAKSAKAAATPTDWKILGKDAEVKAGSLYTLSNNTDHESVRYGKRTWGINMVWDKSTTLNNIRLDVKSGATGVIKYGDKVAIHVEKGGYLKYQRRDVGINLVWSTPPVYEWVILGGKKGQPVRTGALLSLFNEPENDFIIYAERPAGINIRWWKDRELAGAGLTDRLRHAAEEMIRNEFEDRAKDYLKGGEAKKK